MSTYRRILLKLSGEALGLDGRLFDHAKIAQAARVIRAVHELGVEVGVVIGAGNIWRGRQGPSANMNAVIADQMGMLGTAINCLAMRDALQREGLTAYVQSAVDMPRFAESYNTQKAMEELKSGAVVLFACGSGNPFFSTDTAVVLRAIEVEADAILMAKNIDGVYSADPRKDPSAVLLRDLTYQQCQEKDLKVVDAAAFALLRDNAFPLVRVFSLEDPDNIVRVLEGNDMGTFIHP